MVIEDTTLTYIIISSTTGGAISLQDTITLYQNRVCACNIFSKGAGQYFNIYTLSGPIETNLSSFVDCGNSTAGYGVLVTTNSKNYLTNANVSKCQTTKQTCFYFHFCKSPSNVSFCNFESCDTIDTSVLYKTGPSSIHYLQVNDCTIYNCSAKNNLVDFTGKTSLFNSNFIDNVVRTTSSPTLINGDSGMTIYSCYFENAPGYTTFAPVIQKRDIRDTKLELNNEYYLVTKCIVLIEETNSNVKTKQWKNIWNSMKLHMFRL